MYRNFIRESIVSGEIRFRNMPIELSDNPKRSGDFLISGSLENGLDEYYLYAQKYDDADQIAKFSPAMNLIVERLSKIKDFLSQHPQILDVAIRQIAKQDFEIDCSDENIAFIRKKYHCPIENRDQIREAIRSYFHF